MGEKSDIWHILWFIAGLLFEEIWSFSVLAISLFDHWFHYKVVFFVF